MHKLGKRITTLSIISCTAYLASWINNCDSLKMTQIIEAFSPINVAHNKLLVLKATMLHTVQLSQSSHYSLRLRPKYSLQNPVFKHPQSTFFP